MNETTNIAFFVTWDQLALLAVLAGVVVGVLLTGFEWGWDQPFLSFFLIAACVVSFVGGLGLLIGLFLGLPVADVREYLQQRKPARV